jgi:hypothetical protein
MRAGPTVTSPGRYSGHNIGSHLTTIEKFIGVAALPLTQRLDILNSPPDDYADLIRDAAFQSIRLEMKRHVELMLRKPRWGDYILSKRQLQINTLVRAASGSIEEIQSHDIFLTDNVISQELLHSLILSARCQTFWQLLTRWFNPLRRTRSLVCRRLTEQVEQHMRVLHKRSGGTEESEVQLIKQLKYNTRQRFGTAKSVEVDIYKTLPPVQDTRRLRSKVYLRWQSLTLKTFDTSGQS